MSDLENEEYGLDGPTDIRGYRLVRTCYACPEQYDVFLGGMQVGYLRLRHGYFYADTPDVGGTTVYETEDVIGDGIFDSTEREKHLGAAIDAIHAHLRSALDATP